MLVKISGKENCEILTANSRDVAEHFEKQHKESRGGKFRHQIDVY